MTYPNGETVTIIRASTKTDPYSQADTLDWTNVSERTVAGVAVAQRSTNEPTTQGHEARVVTGLVAYFPPGTDITAYDRVVVRGVTYVVDGDPFDWASPWTGWRPGTEVILRRYGG